MGMRLARSVTKNRPVQQAKSIVPFAKEKVTTGSFPTRINITPEMSEFIQDRYPSLSLTRGLGIYLQEKIKEDKEK